jgi:electron-transferring-flavoprotein dehydrogenase
MNDVIDRQTMDVDIVCVGFGPATAGFLSTLEKTPHLGSPACPGMPLQVICYERADDVGFGVSGVVTRARGIRATIPDLNPREIPMATPVTDEKVAYLLDPIGASRRSLPLKAIDATLRTLGLPKDHAVELPYTPLFLQKHDGIVMSLGQFMQFIGGRLMASGTVQIWPGSPVEQALIEDDAVRGIRLVDQGPDAPGMDIHAALTVVGDGPVGPVGKQLDRHFGMPAGHHHREWAVGTKMVLDLPPESPLQPGTVFHTFGYPEPEIFGFLYVHPENVATAGIFVPSWFRSPIRTSYRYLQHYLQHPYLWRYLQGAKLRSWGAKSLQESGLRGEPFLAGNGFARIGEGSGTTNVLTGSGVDEAWTSGAQLAEAVVELLQAGKPLTRENLESTYVARRRASWVESEGRVAENARDGFHNGVLTGLFGMALAGFTNGKLSVPGEPKPTLALSDYYRGKITASEIERISADCRAKGLSCHDALMDRVGWPSIPFDGELLVSHQDALLMGGKVQAPPGFADHVHILDASVCRQCAARLCVEICSGQALGAPTETGAPSFDREKCVHCGACQWNCEAGNLAFQAGAGGLHSSEN